MNDKKDDESEAVMIINIHNTVNISLDGITAATGEAESGSLSNLLRAGDAGDDNADNSARVGEIGRQIRDALKSDQNSGSYFNTVNISPDARFFRAGKTDDENSKVVNAVRGALRAGKDGDGKPEDILKTIAKLVG